MLSHTHSEHAFFFTPHPPKLSLRKTQKRWGQVPSRAILTFRFPLMPAAVSRNELQASHHIQYIARLHRAREGLLWAACGTVISEIATLSHLTSSCMISRRGAWVPEGIQYPHFTLCCLGRRRHGAPQRLSGRRCTRCTGQAKSHQAQKAGSKLKRDFWSCHFTARAVMQPFLPSRSSLLLQAQASQPDFFKSKKTNGTQDFSSKNEDSKDWGQQQLHIHTAA